MNTNTTQTAEQPKAQPPKLTPQQKIDAEIEALKLRLEQAKKKKANAEAAIRTKEGKEARKILDRQKYLVGAWALSTMTPEAIKAAMAGYLKGEKERALFGL
jgi:hypothetical protein